MAHVLATNDFPPKLGGIQSYLHELWRRLPAAEVAVYTTRYEGAEAFDDDQQFRIVRDEKKMLFPTGRVAQRIEDLSREVEAKAVVIDPALPLGQLGHRLHLPYGLVLHGAEVTVPGRLPLSGSLLASVVRRASFVIAAGPYPAREAERAAGRGMPPTAVVPPGVDADRFRPLPPAERIGVRKRFGLSPDCLLVLALHRLVPRKGVDVLLKATGRLRASHPDLVVAVGGSGRDEPRLRRIAAEAKAPAVFLGQVSEVDKPSLYGASDVYSMCCRDRWGGLEQEGFGIVFLEAAACALPQLAGASGGAADAVVHGETGLVVTDPSDVSEVATALESLLDDAALRSRLGEAARARVEADFAYERLAKELEGALVGFGAL